MLGSVAVRPADKVQANSMIRARDDGRAVVTEPGRIDDMRQRLRSDLAQDLRHILRKDLRPILRRDLQQGLRQDLRADLRPDLHNDLKHGLRHDLRQDLRPELHRDLRHSLRRDLRHDMRRAPGPRHPYVDGQLAPSTVDETSEADEWELCIRRSEEASARRVVRVAGVHASTPREKSPDYYRLGVAASGARAKREHSGVSVARKSPDSSRDLSPSTYAEDQWSGPRRR